MRKDKILKVLMAPHLSEKAVNQYIFKVEKWANKGLVKAAVEQLFKVNVSAVNMVNVKGANTAKGGKYASWKKAYVVLKDGQTIEIV